MLLMGCMLKINSVTISNKFLSASTWSSLNTLIISAVWCASILQEKQLPSTLTKLLTSSCTFLFLNLSSHYVVGNQVIQTCTKMQSHRSVLY